MASHVSVLLLSGCHEVVYLQHGRQTRRCLHPEQLLVERVLVVAGTLGDQTSWWGGVCVLLSCFYYYLCFILCKLCMDSHQMLVSFWYNCHGFHYGCEVLA